MKKLTTIRITVLAYGNIRKLLKRFDKTIKIEPGSSIKDLFQLLKKPKDEIWMASVNGLIAYEKTKLKNGDEVRLFEPVGGG